MYLKDTSGNPSLSATLAYIAFAVVMIKVLLNGVIVGAFSFGTIDSFAIAAIFTPTFSMYTARRWGNPAPSEPPEMQGPPMTPDDADNGLGGA